MDVLISAPSLDASRNVSGISSVVRGIITTLGADFDFHHLEVGAEQTGGRWQRQLRSARKLLVALWGVLSRRYDVLHINTALNPRSAFRDAVLVQTGRLRGKNVVLHLHGGRYLEDRSNKAMNRAARVLFSGSSRIIALSSSEARHLGREFPRYAARMSFLPNSVDTSLAAHWLDSRRAGRPLQVAFAGRMVPEKGLAQLLAAAQSEPLADVAFSFFGDGPLAPAVRDAASRHSNLRYGGVFDAAAGLEIISSFDVLILPSLSGEGMPMAVVEAMSVGVVPICTPISSSMKEYIDDGVTGIHIEPGSAEAIASAIALLRDDRARLARMSRAACQFAAEKLDTRRNYQGLAGLYRQLAPQAS